MGFGVVGHWVVQGLGLVFGTLGSDFTAYKIFDYIRDRETIRLHAGFTKGVSGLWGLFLFRVWYFWSLVFRVQDIYGW